MKSDKTVQGGMSIAHFRLLIELSSINSEKAVNALEGFLVLGMDRQSVYKYYGISPGYFSILLKKIRQTESIASILFRYYLD